MISYNDIQKGIVKTINTLLGKDACTNRQLFTSPVVRAGQKGTVGAYPVVVVGKLPLSSWGISNTIAEYYNEEELLTRETVYKASFMIDVHGDTEDDVLMIAQQIRDTLFRDYGRQEIRANTGAVVQGISNPSFTFNHISTAYEEVSRLVLDMSVTDVFIETDPNCPSTSFISSTTVDGELYQNDEDTTPLTTTSIAP